jgi:hypothetical protein
MPSDVVPIRQGGASLGLLPRLRRRWLWQRYLPRLCAPVAARRRHFARNSRPTAGSHRRQATGCPIRHDVSLGGSRCRRMT